LPGTEVAAYNPALQNLRTNAAAMTTSSNRSKRPDTIKRRVRVFIGRAYS